MNEVFIICRSQTESFAAYRALDRAGIRGCLTKPPRQSRRNSCSYAIKICACDLANAEQVLGNANFQHEKASY